MLEASQDEDGSSEAGDSKTRLQEIAQARGWGLPEYRHVHEDGPDHEKTFAVECWLEGEPRGEGLGRSKKSAEQAAATAALSQITG